MKTAVLNMAVGLAVLSFSACNNDTSNSGDAAKNSSAATETPATAPAPQTEVAKGNPAISAVIGHYLHVKDALAADNGTEAASGAKAMVAELANIDQAAFTEAQKKTYADVADDLKEMAEHISENASKIEHQREHFVMMSDDVVALAKGFGYTAPLYVSHCPMANDNKGADWVSATEAISNPYMGKKMPKCGDVKEVIK